MFKHCLAYRWANGDVEGFKGIGSTKTSARNDAIQQIQRKMSIVPTQKFNPDSVIESDDSLTLDERKLVRDDWQTNVRY